MQTTIEIKNLKIYAKHGVLEEEKKTAQPFIFNATLFVNYLNAALTDDLAQTISYCDVMQDIKDFCENNSFNLIETLTYKCALMLIKKYRTIDKIVLAVNKPEAPFDLEFETVQTKISMCWHKVYLSLGSNLGKKQAQLKKAVKLLDAEEEIEVKKVSSFYKNPPYGGVATEEFVNIAVEIDTLLDPFDLLDRIHKIEAALGRKRTVRWGNRTMDIDIIFYDDLQINTRDLTIPHKDYKNRDFVIVPLSEIAPHLF